MKKIPISEYPHMMAQWHPTKNPQFDVHTTAAGTRAKAWWICGKCGYEWESLISTRKESKGYCPRCDKDKQGPKTSITISMVPNLIDFFDREANPDIDPYTLTATKRKKARWKCPVCAHKWIADIHNRYYDKTGCPACAGKVLTDANNVLTKFPDLLKLYDYDYPNNPPLERLYHYSKDIVHWKCPDCGYEWEQPVSYRINDGKVAGCAICTGTKILGTYEDEYSEVSKMYSPSNITPFRELHAKDRTTVFLWNCLDCGFEFESTLGTMLHAREKPHRGCPACLGRVIAAPGESIADLHPELLGELDDDTDLYKILPYSSKVVHWKCPTCSYKWTTTIALRNMGFGNCPVCNNIRPVKGYNTVADLFADIAKQWAPSNEASPDELLPSSCRWVKLICKDCGGEHGVQVKRAVIGNIKCPYCSGAKALPGVNSLKAIHPDWLEHWDYDRNSSDPDNIRADASSDHFWLCCKGHSYSMKISFRAALIKEGRELCPYCDERRIERSVSLASLYPSLMKYWNESELPFSIMPISTARHNWKCDLGHEYARSPYEMVSDLSEGRVSCPYCDGRFPTPGVNSLKALHPEWMNEFDCSNSVDPDSVFESYSFPLLWICSQGHHYQRSPSLRLKDQAEGRVSCPYCNNRHILPGFNSFAAKHKDLLDEWDYVNNYIIADPDQISENSTIKVWFRCMAVPEHDKFEMQVSSRVMFKLRGRNPCPMCKGRRRKKKRFV